MVPLNTEGSELSCVFAVCGWHIINSQTKNPSELNNNTPLYHKSLLDIIFYLTLSCLLPAAPELNKYNTSQRVIVWWCSVWTTVVVIHCVCVAFRQSLQEVFTVVNHVSFWLSGNNNCVFNWTDTFLVTTHNFSMKNSELLLPLYKMCFRKGPKVINHSEFWRDWFLSVCVLL